MTHYIGMNSFQELLSVTSWSRASRVRSAPAQIRPDVHIGDCKLTKTLRCYFYVGLLVFLGAEVDVERSELKTSSVGGHGKHVRDRRLVPFKTTG